MIQGMKSYRHLEEKDRRRIAKLKSYKLSVSEIARRTGFNKATISRELKRNGYRFYCDHTDTMRMFEALGYTECVEQLKKKSLIEDYWSYHGKKADIASRWRRIRSSRRQRITKATQDWIVECLKLGWSPQQIAGRSKSQGQKVSHEYVYKFILKDKRKGGHLYRLLKRFGKRKQRLGRRQYTPVLIPGRVSIKERPSEVILRKRLGDLEGDLIIGRNNKAHILSVIDRTSRLIALELLKTRKKEDVERAFLRAFKRMPVLRTLTLDNAREFSCHLSLSKKTGIRVYFADPYSSHQRGSIENANGLVRYYLPKKTDFSLIKSTELRKIEKLINNRPRKVLNYLKPIEASQNIVALQS